MPRSKKMATDTTEITGAATEDDENEEKAKRERVDLETLSPDEKVTLSFAVPAGLKLALIKAGEAESLSGTSFARNILAQRMEYAVPTSFTERTRKHKYATDEERKAAQAAKSKSQRDMVKAVLAAAGSGRLDPALLASLGIQIPA